ncbi:Uncharacterised protein [Mycobacteroides abscessus subsp. abscessus]|nr:Uncharacterised protein [Mycobacteroides abscessus subsp. abscessus]SKU59954.1 Uncharacterised protein [Mycobacteroides abscessus subsp. abscessus]
MSPPSDRSWAADTSPSRDAAVRTCASSCSRARSTLGGVPPRWSCATCAQIDPSNSSAVSPSRISVSPGSVPNPVGMRRFTSSITPSTPTTGVGRMGVVPVWL